MTRKQRQADTRRRLVRAAAQVGARRGIARASVDEVAETAGFTKGAVYANFASKQELFLAVLDERFAERLEQIERRLASGADPHDQARRLGADLTRCFDADCEWARLFFEFAVHAARDETFRVQLTARHRALRERIAAALQRRLDKLGVEPRQPAGDLALMTFAMANGVALEAMLEPEAVPADLLGRMFELLTANCAPSTPPHA